MQNKILVLGCNGMLGHMVSLYLKEKGYIVKGFARQPSNIVDTIVGDATNFKLLESIILHNDYSYVINCIGILNDDCDNDPCNAILLNSYLPHFLAKITENSDTKIIHISTDCVFSGKRGQYKVDDEKDSQSLYGISKSLGELNDSRNITIRTSIIGPDLNKDGIGLFNWFTHQTKSVMGYENVYWTGLTTLELSKVIEKIVSNGLCGLYNVVPDTKISKCDLLKLLGSRFNPIEIIPIGRPITDKSLVNSFPFEIPSYEDMIDELYSWIKEHDSIYN